MPASATKAWLGLCTLATSACALTGYDFGDYQPVVAAVAGDPAGGAAEAPLTDEPAGGGASAGSAGAMGPVATTFGLGGDPFFNGPNGNGGAGPGSPAACEPATCGALGVECGIADNGCGAPQNCGACFWWFQECRQNRCEIAE